MPTITFLITNHQPILATSFQGDPNTDVSYGYLPGSLIRGALISRYINQNGNLDVEDPEVRRLFFDGQTRYLNAYICNSDNQRTLPVPHCFFHHKNEPQDKIYNLSCREPSDFQKKAINGFCTVGSSVTLYQEKRRLNIHNQRNRYYGRGREGDGEIFRYNALEAGQTFGAAILCESDEDAKTLQQLLERNPFFSLGGSQTAGYGRAEIKSIAAIQNWSEVPRSLASRTQETTHFAITLTSDLLIRNCFGQFVAEPPTAALAAYLGVELEERISYLKATYVGGFNRKWGLPLPQVQAIAAGSVFIYSCLNLPQEALSRLEREGLGERRSEGFGQVVINWFENTAEFFQTSVGNDRSNLIPELTEDSPSATLAKQMAERILRTRLEQELIRNIERFPICKNMMQNRQWSRLMLAARKASALSNQQPIIDLFNSLRNNAKTQFDRTEFERGDKLQKKVEAWLDESGGLWGAIDPVNVAGQKMEVTPALAKEYTFRLIIGLAKKMMKEAV